MSYTKESILILGWLLDELPVDSAGEEIDINDEKFEPYIDQKKGVKEAIIHDDIAGSYMAFGILISELHDETDICEIKTKAITGIDVQSLKDKFRELFDADPPDQEPMLTHFFHYV